MLLLKRFSRDKDKLNGFLTQVRIKIINKGLGLPIFMEQVAYTGLFLLRQALEQFKFYFIKIQLNRLTITDFNI